MRREKEERGEVKREQGQMEREGRWNEGGR